MTTANLDHQDLNDALSAPGLVREEIMERVWLIDRFPLDFTDLCSSARSGNRYAEFNTDELGSPAAPGGNKHVDGSDIVQDDSSIGTRQGNHHQIMVKAIQVSTRANAVRSLGRQGTVAYQVMRAQQRLRRDAEAQLLSDRASVEDDGNTTPGELGGFFSWIKTNVTILGDGTAGGFNSSTKLLVAPTPSTTPGALTETAIRDVAQKVYQEGGDVYCIMMRPSVQRKLSEYLFTSSARIATQTNYNQGENAGMASTAYGAHSVFVTDFNQVLLMKPNRLMPPAEGKTTVSHMAFLDPKHMFTSFVTGYRVEPLAKTGLSSKRMVSVDISELITNEKAVGGILDIDETQAVAA